MFFCAAQAVMTIIINIKKPGTIFLIILYFQVNNTVKEVRNAEFGPVFLREAALEIDQLVKENIGDRPKMDNTWKKISDSPKGD